MSETGRETTLDTVFPGSLTCLQYREGYRFNQDSVLLAHFVQPGSGERLLDMGTGCGIIGLILAFRWSSIKIVGLEIQPGLADLARRNFVDNGFGQRAKIVEGDFNNEKLLEDKSFDRIICNPPYMDPKKSRSTENQEMAIARQGLRAGPEELGTAVHRLLVDGGKFNVIYPAERTPQLLSALTSSGVFPVKIRPVHSHPRAPEMLIMIEAEKNGDRKLEILSPFYISLEKGGEYSQEMSRCYAP